MKRSPVILSVAIMLALGLSTVGVSAASKLPGPAKVRMSVKVLSVAPRTISKKNQVIIVRVRYTGIVMDPLGIGRKPVAGHGHMQVYLNRVPSSAYKTGTSKHVVVVATTTTFHFVLSRYWRKAAHGHHRFLIALARNDNILYRVNAASFSLTVK